VSARTLDPCWRYLRFSVRTLIVLVIVVGAGLGWIVRFVRSTRAQREAVAAIERAGGRVWYDWEQKDGNPTPFARPRVPRWLGDRVGWYYFGDVVVVELVLVGSDAELIHVGNLSRLERLLLFSSPVTDDGVTHLKGLTCLQELNLSFTEVTNAGLENLKGLTGLKALHLDSTAVSDGGLVHLKGLTRLQELALGHTRVTDAGLAQLTGLTGLRVLSLDATQVTDTGLARLKGLTELQVLGLRGTHVSDVGVQELQKSLPKVMVRVTQWPRGMFENEAASPAAETEVRKKGPEKGVRKKGRY